uniref:Uncharacterized protein n=1 Tax=Nelumbo nucifera TaxID=4432 RepID=A0A822XQA2_NELNU|nr:TPA_asm: hypothetical protein HUJ06_023675 [Nelumbo nucifera]
MFKHTTLESISTKISVQQISLLNSSLGRDLWDDKPISTARDLWDDVEQLAWQRSPGAVRMGSTGFHGQCCHVRSRQAVVHPGEGEDEVELSRLELLGGVQGWNEGVVEKLVGVSDEARRRLHFEGLG